MLLSKIDVHGESTDKFYSPVSKYGYLTPAQRKKLREKRNLNFPHSEELSTFKTSKQPSKTKSAIKKSKHKIQSKTKWKPLAKELLRKKIVKSNIPEVRCTAAQLIATAKNENVTKKFFKTRSPEHFKKANFVVPLVYKRSRLDFNSGKHSNSHNSSLSDSNYSVDDNSDVGDALESSKIVENHPNYLDITIGKHSNSHNSSLSDSNYSLDDNLDVGDILVSSKSNEKPTIVYVLPAQKSDESNGELLSSSKDEKEQRHRNLLLDIQQSFMEICDLPESVIKNDHSEESNSSEVLESESGLNTTDSKEADSPKLYPIFYMHKVKKVKPESTEESTVVKKTPCIKDTSKGDGQMIIDAGQKEIGAKQCKTCNMIYFIGQEEDEKLHSEYHDMYLVNLRFPGWKNENIVGNFEDGRVIRVTKEDKNKLKKVQDVLLIANRDLGFPSAELPKRPNLNFLLFITNDKKVKGCLVAESITSASPIVLDETLQEKNKLENGNVIWELGSWYASSKTVPAVCGINRIWVAKDYRRHKVASRLIDCLRHCFTSGRVVSLEELAFTDPTDDGRNFAARYTGTDNFLVYK